MFFFVFFLLINQIILWRIEKTFLSPAGIFTLVWLLSSIFYSAGYLEFYEPVNKLITTLFLIFSSYYLGYYHSNPMLNDLRRILQFQNYQEFADLMLKIF